MAQTPVILFDAWPRTPDLVCEPEVLERLRALGEVRVAADRPFSEEELDAMIPEVDVILGETALPTERVDRAGQLKALINISGNFPTNVDYSACQRRGVYVLTAGSAFSVPVAESALAMAIDLCRGISRHDRAFRDRREVWFHEGTRDDTRLFTGSRVGIIGFGDLGRALRRMLVPFTADVVVYDPWVAPEIVRREGCRSAGLDELLSTCRVVFVFASPTTENQHFLGARELARLADGTAFVLMSRAGVVDFDALVAEVASGRIRAAIDVFPQEPMPSDHLVRDLDWAILSGHRTGGMTEAFHEIGRLAVGDTELVLRGLPPQLCRRGDAAIAGKFRDGTRRSSPSRELYTDAADVPS